MGYELHIVRTESWLEAETNPISRDEWNAYATRHPKLVEDGWVEWLDIGREPCYSFVKNDGIEVSLSWRHGDVRIGGPFGTVGELATIAAELGATLVGDEDEVYTADSD